MKSISEVYLRFGCFVWIPYHANYDKLKIQVASSVEIKKVSISLQHPLIFSLITFRIRL
jgi:hypothetical protein